MTDYIKRESRTFTEIADDLNDLLTELNDKIVESIWAKTADVAPVRHGRWKKDYLCSTNGGTYSVIRCSECDFQFPMTVTNYCPNCGAKMDEENGDED